MNILNWIKSLFFKEPVRNFGIVDTIDTVGFNDSVYAQNEIVASVAIPSFKGINKDGSVRKFTYQYQNGSSACVAFTTAKIAQILYFLKFDRIVKWSPRFWYFQRSNKPQEGMAFQDIKNLASSGSLTEELLPSFGLSEKLMNTVTGMEYLKESADGFAISPTWVELPLDFDTVASTIEQTTKGIMLWFKFGPGEFFYTSYPKITGNNTPWAHSVTAVDTTIINGKQYLVIEDSADYEANYVKYVDRNFFTRCYLARYPIAFKFEPVPAGRPVFDGSIKSLQDILKYEGFMASNVQSTGYFGDLTKQALIKFQLSKGISPAIGVFGTLTKNFLLSNYK